MTDAVRLTAWQALWALLLAPDTDEPHQDANAPAGGSLRQATGATLEAGSRDATTPTNT
jgi:hypothetical protein